MPVGAGLGAERELGAASRRYYPHAAAAVVAAAVAVEMEALAREANADPASSRLPLLELSLGLQGA